MTLVKKERKEQDIEVGKGIGIKVGIEGGQAPKVQVVEKEMKGVAMKVVWMAKETPGKRSTVIHIWRTF